MTYAASLGKVRFVVSNRSELLLEHSLKFLQRCCALRNRYDSLILQRAMPGCFGQIVQHLNARLLFEGLFHFIADLEQLENRSAAQIAGSAALVADFDFNRAST